MAHISLGQIKVSYLWLPRLDAGGIQNLIFRAALSYTIGPQSSFQQPVISWEWKYPAILSSPSYTPFIIGRQDQIEMRTAVLHHWKIFLYKGSSPMANGANFVFFAPLEHLALYAVRGIELESQLKPMELC